MDVVDIRWGLAVLRGDTGDFVGVSFKRDEPRLTELPMVDWDGTELAEDTGLTLILEPDLEPAREERVNREVILANEARVINTFLIH